MPALGRGAIREMARRTLQPSRRPFLALAWHVVHIVASPSSTGLFLVGDSEVSGAPNLLLGRGNPTSISVSSEGLFVSKGDLPSLEIGPEVVKIPKLSVNGDLVVAESMAVGVQPQWALWDLDSFDAEGADSNHWSLNDHGACGPSHDAFLGGHCRFAGTTTARHYTGLPEHSRVRVRARVHYFDDWQDQSVVLMAEGQKVWSESHNWCPGFLKWMCKKYGIDTCGRQTPDRLSVKAEATFVHSGPNLALSFTSDLPLDTDPCYTSWGVDDVSVELM